MPAPDFDDLYNSAEIAVRDTLRSHAWLGDADNVRLIHEKLNREGDMPLYADHETPAIGIWCSGQDRDVEDTLDERGYPLRIVLDVVVFGGDDHEVDNRCKLITWRARRMLGREMYPARFDGATELDGFATGGTLELSGEVNFDVVQLDNAWYAEGATQFTVTVFDDG